jgi:site-specific recombinase XerD
MQGKTTDTTRSSNLARTKSPKKSGSKKIASLSDVRQPKVVPLAAKKPGTGATASQKTATDSNRGTVAAVPVAGANFCPFKELVEEWLEHCQASGLSSKTLADYKDKVLKFRWWWVEHSQQPPHPKNITNRDARAFALYLREPATLRWGLEETSKTKSKLSPASIASYGRSVKVFFNWLEREKYISQSPFNKSIKFSTRNQERVVKDVSQEELRLILDVLSSEAGTGSYVGLRNMAIFSLLLDSGMRRGELLSMKLGEIDLKAGKCLVRGKSGMRYALFSDTCRRAISRYYKRWRCEQNDRPDSPFWLTEDGEPLSYNGFGSMIRRLEKASGVDFHAHKLRHTFATLMANQGTNVFDLKELLGHSSITTTQIYIQSNVDHLSRVHHDKSPLANLGAGTVDKIKRRRGRPASNNK